MSLQGCLNSLVSVGNVDKELATKLANDVRERVKVNPDANENDVNIVKQLKQDKADSAFRSLKSIERLTTLKGKIGEVNKSQGLSALLEHDYTGKFKYDNAVPGDVYSLAKGYMGYYTSDMAAFAERFRSKKVMGRDFNDKYRRSDLYDVVRNVIDDKKSSNPDLNGMAESYKSSLKQIELELRKLGIKTNVVQNPLRQSHDNVLIQKAGKEAWSKFITPLIDMEKSGFKSEDSLNKFLDHTYTDIVTNGLGSTVEANSARNLNARGSSPDRVIHFKNADAFLTYHENFGIGDLYENMIKNIDHLTKEMALGRTFGPEYQKTFDILNNAALAEQALDPNVSSNMQGFKEYVGSNDAMFKVLTGQREGTGNVAVGRLASGFTNLFNAAHLGKAVFSSVQDLATAKQTAKVLDMSFGNLMGKYLQGMAGPGGVKAARKMAAAQGQIVDGLVTGSMTAARLVDDQVGGKFSKFSKNAVEAVVRRTGLEAHTAAVKSATQASFNNEYASLAHLSFDQLPQQKQQALKFLGFDDKDWGVLSKAVDPSGDFIDPHKITDRNTLEKWISGLTVMSRMAVPEPAAYVQAALGANMAPGTAGHILKKSVGNLMSYNISAIHMQAQILRNNILLATKGSKAGWLAGSIVYGTIMSGIGLQLSNMASGNDIRNMEDSGFWLDALTRGTGGIIGAEWDLVAKSKDAGDLAKATSGSVPGMAFSLIILSKKLGVDLFDREKTSLDVRKDAAALVKETLDDMTPGGNAWMVGVAYDRMIKDQIEKFIDPMAGLSFMQAAQNRLEKRGTEQWWDDGAMLPKGLPKYGQKPQK